MNNKNRFRPLDALILLLAFHLIANILWIKFNNTPPKWDDSYNIVQSLQYSQFFRSLLTTKVDLNILKQAFADFYGPLVRIISGFVLFLFGDYIKLAQFVGTLFFLSTIWLIYKTGKFISHSGWVGGLAATSFSFYQLVYDNSRWLLLDIPLTFFITLTYYFLFKSNWCEKRRETILASVAFVLATLTKINAFMYLVFPAIACIFLTTKLKDKARLINMLLAILFSLLAIAPWFILSYQNLQKYYSIASLAEAGDPTGLTHLTTWFFYLKALNNTLFALPGTILFFISLFFYFAENKNVKHRDFLLPTITVSYIITTIFPNKDVRFIFPLLPFLSLVFALGMFKLIKIKKYLGLLLTSALLLFNLVSYTSLSFGFPLKKNQNVKFIVLPYFGDLTLFNFSQYPVRKFNSYKWPHQQIVKDLNIESQKKPIYTVVIPNYEDFNSNNLNLYAAVEKKQHIAFIRFNGKLKFESREELQAFLSKLNYFLFDPNDQSIQYAHDKQAADQLSAAVQELLQYKQAVIIKNYLLPDNHSIWLVKKS